jgi:hypothetical protein
VETFSHSFRRDPGRLSDGNFVNEVGNSEPYSSTFCFSLEIPSPFVGKHLVDLGITLLYQGIVMFAPLLDRERPYSYGLAVDTNLPVHLNASHRVAAFVQALDCGETIEYSMDWARCLDPRGWPLLSSRIRNLLRDNSNVTFD